MKLFNIANGNGGSVIVKKSSLNANAYLNLYEEINKNGFVNVDLIHSNKYSLFVQSKFRSIYMSNKTQTLH